MWRVFLLGFRSDQLGIFNKFQLKKIDETAHIKKYFLGSKMRLLLKWSVKRFPSHRDVSFLEISGVSEPQFNSI